MDKNKKPAQMLAHPSGQGRNEAHDSTGPSHAYYTGSTRENQQQVADFLGRGRAAAISLAQLKKLLGWDGRTIRKEIARARRAGVPIVSDNLRGYWLADNPAEVEAFVRSMRGRAREIERTVAALDPGSVGDQT